MKIYIDLILIQDTFMMSTILFLFNKILNLKLKMIRILTISFFSSIISICILMYLPNLYDNLLIKITLSFFIVKYGVGIKNLKDIASQIIFLWIITILFGGINFITEGNVIQMFLLILIIVVIILKYKMQHQNKLLLEATICFIEFDYIGEKYSLKALVDTGHNTKTLYNEDVIFVQQNLINIEGGEKRKRRTVKYKTISGTEEKSGIKICNIKINYAKKEIYNNAVIVSTPNIINNYDAIVSLSIIEGGKTIGNYNAYKAKS